jgi:broad specificity phosphatase PhoE
MNRIADSCAEDDQILIVSHGSFCLYMLEVLFGIDQKELRRNSPGYPVPNGGIAQVAYEKGVWKLLALPQDPDVYQTV